MDSSDHHNTWDGDYDSDQYSENPNYLSDNSDVEDYEDWEDPQSSSRVEPTFHLQDTSVLSDLDAGRSVELHQSLLSYGTDFDELANQDPVYERILEFVKENAMEPEIIVYSKVNFIKLATINKAKASNLQDVVLSSMMEAVSLAQGDEAVRRETQNKEERIIRDCIDQIHWLNKQNHLEDHVVATLKNIIKASRYQIPSVIKEEKVDDLCGVLYAIISDDYYKDAPIATEDAIPSQTDHVTATTSNSKPESKPLKHIPQPGNRFSINLITHLTLVGGLPMHFEKVFTSDKASYQEVMRKVSCSLQNSQSLHRLGFLTRQQMDHGNWLYQAAADMKMLDWERDGWQVVDDISYKKLLPSEEEEIFMIHEYHLGMPARIGEKVRGRPKVWNTWDLLVSPTLTSPPAPEFVPCSKGIVIKPASMGMVALSKALPKPQAKGPPVDKQEVKQGRRNKRIKQKKNKGKATAKPATFQLPLR
ncbi:hypothetical protein KCU78_g5742, partial [Aureobasidium melanogenum]